MNKTILIIIVLLTCNLIVSQHLKQQHLDSIFNTLEKENTSMGSLFISKNNTRIYSKSIGYSSIEDNAKATENTKYRIGSITKIFTAVMIFQLIDDNKLSLDSKLSEFYPKINNANKISIGNLLNHRSGIFNFTKQENFNPYISKSKSQMLAEIEKFTPDFDPGTQSEYSNTNYIILGYILEKIYKQSYSEILKHNITVKLGLDNTYYGDSINIKDNEAFSYIWSEKWGKSKETNLNLPHGAGAIVSTSKELTIFMDALMHGKLISDASLKQMKVITEGLGYGISKFMIYDREIYGHSGGIDGFTSLLIFDPKENISVAYTSNASKTGIREYVINGLETFMSIPFEKTEGMEVNKEYLNAFVGVYSSENAPFTLTFYLKEKENKLFGGPTGNHHNHLLPTKENQFKLESEGATIDFNPNENSLILFISGRELPFSKQ